MAGLPKPWASRSDALFWAWMLRLGFGGGLAVAAGGLLAWGLLLHPVIAAWHGTGFAIAPDAATWMPWLRRATLAAAALGTLFSALLAWYCDAMLRGSGKAEH